MTKLYGLCLSNNPTSINRQFLETLMPQIGGTVIPFSQTDFPLFCQGLATPENLIPLCDTLKNADGLILSSPEYNGSLSPFGKNVLDWISTQGAFSGGQKSTPLTGIPTMICTVAPGPLGGIRCVPELSRIAIELGCTIHKTHATTGGFRGDDYDYTTALSIAKEFKTAITK